VLGQFIERRNPLGSRQEARGVEDAPHDAESVHVQGLEDRLQIGLDVVAGERLVI